MMVLTVDGDNLCVCVCVAVCGGIFNCDVYEQTCTINRRRAKVDLYLLRSH